MDSSKKYLCRDINGNVHIVGQTDLIKRTSVYGVIKDENGALLVRDRSSDEKWDIPGGGLEEGEDLMTALRREMLEETKLEIVGEPEKICEFTEYFYDIDGGKGWESTRHFYKVVHQGEAQMTGNDDDIVEARYFQEPYSTTEVSAVSREILAMVAESAA